MALQLSRGGREYDKFVDDGSGNTAVRAVISGGTVSGNLTITGDLTVQGDFNFGDAVTDVLTINGQAFLGDDIQLTFGNTAASPDVKVTYDTTDANANFIKWGFKSGDSTNVPVLALGIESAIIGADLGFLDGETEPALVILDATGAKYGGLQWGGTFMDFISDGVGTQFRFPGPLNLGSSVLFAFDQNITFGTGNEGATLIQSSTQGSGANGATMFGLGSDNYSFIITGKSIISSNHDHAAASTPTLFIHSSTNPDTANDEWVSFSHDITRARYSTGSGCHAFGSGTPGSFVVETSDDVYVTGELEVDSILYADNLLKVLNGAIWAGIGKSSGIQFSGTASTRGGIIYDTDEGMSLVAGDSDGNGNHVINIISGGNVLKDHDQDTFQTDPVLNIFSATDPDTDNTQYGSLKHDQTDFVISSAKGTVSIEVPTTISEVFRGTGDNTTGEAYVNYRNAITTTSSTTPSMSLVLSPGPISNKEDAPKIQGYRIGDAATAGDRDYGLKFYVTDSNSSSLAYSVDNNKSIIPEGRVTWKQGADVASANDLTLGYDGNSFEITGTTQINAITTTDWGNGAVITLLFTSTPTVKHNTAGGAGTAPILLAGAADFSATAGDTLTLLQCEIGGTVAWREIARAAI